MAQGVGFSHFLLTTNTTPPPQYQIFFTYNGIDHCGARMTPPLDRPPLRPRTLVDTPPREAPIPCELPNTAQMSQNLGVLWHRQRMVRPPKPGLNNVIRSTLWPPDSWALPGDMLLTRYATCATVRAPKKPILL